METLAMGRKWSNLAETKGIRRRHLPLVFGNILPNVLIILLLTISGYETIKMTLKRPIKY